MVAKVREILAVSKQAAQKFDVETIILRNLQELEVRKRKQIKISKSSQLWRTKQEQGHKQRFVKH
jgi:hypothetical protein